MTWDPPKYDPEQHQRHPQDRPMRGPLSPQGYGTPVPQPSQRTYRLAARRQKSTLIHGILTALTLGLWSPFWIMACAENARIRKAQAQVAMYQSRQPR